ncbi:MAG: heavy-metal-associated domain-containing protein [Pirellulaceae bacterium]
MKSTYQISGMHCGACVKKVTQALASVGGVRDVDVSLEGESVALERDDQVRFEDLAAAVSDAGDYRISENQTSTPKAPSAAPAAEEKKESLYPLFLIVGYLLGVVALIAFVRADWSLEPMMRHFMAGFFLVFSFFKLLDPPGFVTAYRDYDLLAKRSAAWAWAYPGVELLLGVAYLVNWLPVVTNSVVLVLMLVGAAGVLKALLDKKKIRCACLGTALNLPMTTVTLVEDLTMAAMAAAMLVLHLSWSA